MAAATQGDVGGPATSAAKFVRPPSPRPDLALFGEGPSRIVVSVPADARRAFEALMAEFVIPWRWIGVVGGERLDVRIGGELAVSVPVMQIAREWRNGFERHVS